MRGYRSVHFLNHARPFELFGEVTPVCVEVYETSGPLATFAHPETAVYVVGRSPEAQGTWRNRAPSRLFSSVSRRVFEMTVVAGGEDCVTSHRTG